MFSLLVVIISIVLVTTLSLVTLYYGAPAYNNWKAVAASAATYNQAMQIFAAAQMYYSDTGSWPSSVSQLLGHYLATEPIPPSDLANNTATSLATASAQAASALAYELVLDENNVLTYVAVSGGVQGNPCLATNRKERGLISLQDQSFDEQLDATLANLSTAVGSANIYMPSLIPAYQSTADIQTLTEAQKRTVASATIVPNVMDSNTKAQCITENTGFSYFFKVGAGGAACSAITKYNLSKGTNIQCNAGGVAPPLPAAAGSSLKDSTGADIFEVTGGPLLGSYYSLFNYYVYHFVDFTGQAGSSTVTLTEIMLGWGDKIIGSNTGTQYCDFVVDPVCTLSKDSFAAEEGV